MYVMCHVAEYNVNSSNQAILRTYPNPNSNYVALPPLPLPLPSIPPLPLLSVLADSIGGTILLIEANLPPLISSGNGLWYPVRFPIPHTLNMEEVEGGSVKNWIKKAE